MRKFFHANISSVCVSASSAKFITLEIFYVYSMCDVCVRVCVSLCVHVYKMLLFCSLDNA